MIRFLLRRTVSGFVLAGVLLTAQAGFAQTPAQTSTGQAASQPAMRQAAASDDQAPLTPRERQLLQQVRDLKERVAALEERVSKTPDSQEVEERLAALEQRVSKTPDSRPVEPRLAVLEVTKTPDSLPVEAKAPEAQTQQALAKQVGAQPETGQKETGNEETSQKESGQKVPPPPVYVPPAMEGTQGGGEQSVAAASATTFGFQERKKFGAYTPNYGFTVADTNYGSMNVSIFSYVRYLNQLDLNPTYTNAFGTVSNVQLRHSFQLNKVQVKFLGWVASPKLRYFLYVWTSNSNQGQGAQVVVAENLNYDFNKHLTLSGGINALPGTRSVEGNFPFWLGEDSRLIADEFFRGSYTSGIWAKGEINWRLRYQVMLGNNLSTLGVNAGQLNHLSTVATALVWMPSTGEFGAGFGDFENHEKVATRVGVHFSRSKEDKQSQPDTEVFDNTQIRLSDGTVIFTPNLFGPGITVNKVRYRMTSFDGGVKYHGYRWRGNTSCAGSMSSKAPARKASLGFSTTGCRSSPRRWWYPRPCRSTSGGRRFLASMAIPLTPASVPTGSPGRTESSGGILRRFICISHRSGILRSRSA